MRRVFRSQNGQKCVCGRGSVPRWHRLKRSPDTVAGLRGGGNGQEGRGRETGEMEGRWDQKGVRNVSK